MDFWKTSKFRQPSLAISLNLNNLRYKKLIKRIKKHESFSLKPYKDHLGFLTIGYGHLILPNEKNLLSNKISKTKLEKLFNQDFKKAVNDYKKFLETKTSNIT